MATNAVSGRPTHIETTVNREDMPRIQQETQGIGPRFRFRARFRATAIADSNRWQ